MNIITIIFKAFTSRTLFGAANPSLSYFPFFLLNHSAFFLLLKQNFHLGIFLAVQFLNNSFFYSYFLLINYNTTLNWKLAFDIIYLFILMIDNTEFYHFVLFNAIISGFLAIKCLFLNKIKIKNTFPSENEN